MLCCRQQKNALEGIMGEKKEKFSQRILMTLLIYVKQIKTKTFLLSIIRVTRVTADYDETIKRFPQMVMKSFFFHSAVENSR